MATLSVLFSLNDSDEELSEATNFAANVFLNWIREDTFALAEQTDKSGLAGPLDGLLHAVDWDNRWSYRGSLTSPGCDTGVSQNILRTVLPISALQLTAIKDFTLSHDPTFYTRTDGNWRAT